MHVCIFSCLSIASVDDKQHLNEVVLVLSSNFHCISQVCTTGSPKNTTGMSLITYVMLCSAGDRSCGQQAIDASYTTMLQHIPCTWFILFWQKARLLWLIRLLTLLIWVPATSDCSLNSRGRKSDTFLTMKFRPEHYTLPPSSVACHQLTLLTGRKKFMNAYKGSR